MASDARGSAAGSSRGSEVHGGLGIDTATKAKVLRYRTARSISHMEAMRFYNGGFRFSRIRSIARHAAPPPSSSNKAKRKAKAAKKQQQESLPVRMAKIATLRESKVEAKKSDAALSISSPASSDVDEDEDDAVKERLCSSTVQPPFHTGRGSRMASFILPSLRMTMIKSG